MNSAVLNTDFSLNYLKEKNEPEQLGFWYPHNSMEFPRLLHYMIKGKGSNVISFAEAGICEILVGVLFETAQKYGVNPVDRYIYVTIDKGNVKKGESLRSPGWHIDGLQGDEVSVKYPGDLQVIWSNDLPTEYISHPFEVDHLDISKHNVFDALAQQVREDDVERFKPYGVNAHSSYLVHRSAIATEDIYDRKFVRVSMSNIPITSVKMTRNPAIIYDYETHTTTGEIPKHLV